MTIARPKTEPIPVQHPNNLPIPGPGQVWETHDSEGRIPPKRWRVEHIQANNLVLMRNGQARRIETLEFFDGERARYVGG